MAEFDEKEAFQWIQTYYNEPRKQMKAVEWFLAALEGDTRAQSSSLRVRMSNAEKYQEAALCLLVAFDRCIAVGNCKGFRLDYIKELKRAFGKYSNRRRFYDKADDNIEAPGPLPDEIAAKRQQFRLAKEFLDKHYDPNTVEQFMEKFSDGKTYNQIAGKWGRRVQNVQRQLTEMMDRVQKYMKRVNDG